MDKNGIQEKILERIGELLLHDTPGWAENVLNLARAYAELDE